MQSPPEYSPSDGIIIRYGLGHNTVVAATVAALTGDPSHDEKAYVLVENGTQQTQATSAFIAAGADMNKVVFYTVQGDSVWRETTARTSLA